MEELNLTDLFNYILSKILIIILIILLFTTGSVVYSMFIQKPMYQSYTTILLTKEENTAITYTDLNLNRSLVDTYSVIIKSNTVMKQVISNLKLDYSVGDLKKLVSVESVNDTEIIKVTVKNSDPVLARDIANEIAKVFNVEVVKLYNIQNIGVVDVAEVNDVPYNVSFTKQVVIGTFIGVVLSLGFVFVLFYFDTTIKNADDVEKKLGIPVIGTVPLSGGKKNE